MKSRDIYWRRYKIQKTSYTGQWCPFKVGTLGPHTVLPIAISCTSYFPETHWLPEISSLSKVILGLGKARILRVPNLGCRGTESPEWFDVLPKNFAQDMMHEQERCRDEAANHQLSRAAAFWIIWIVPVEECSSLMQNLMQIHCYTRTVILNIMTTQYTCSLKGIYCPH